MSEEIGGELVPDSTRDLDIDGELDLMIEDLDLWYGSNQALYGVSLPLQRTVSRLDWTVRLRQKHLAAHHQPHERPHSHLPIRGKITKGDLVITDKGADLVELRKSIGMVFQRPNPFPKSIYENAYGVRLHHQPTREELDAISRKEPQARSDLEGSRRTSPRPRDLSRAVQQRLCIAQRLPLSRCHPDGRAAALGSHCHSSH